MAAKNAWALALALAASGCALRNARAPLGPDRAQPSRDYFDRGEYSRAAFLAGELLVQERLTPNELQRAYWTLARSYEGLGDLDKALSTYQVAVQLFPKNKGLTLALAQLLHRTGLDERARPHFERVLRAEAKNSAANLGLAETFRSLGLLDQAVEHYRTALEANPPGAARPWKDFAETLAEQKRLEEAERAMNKAIALSPEPDNLHALALFQRRQGKNPEAYASLQLALQAEPGRRDLELQRALWLLKDGRLEEAMASVARFPPDDPLANFIQGVASLKRGERDRAAEHLRLASRGTPLVAEASASLLKEMGGNP